jgi:hypothetical protein
MSDTVRLRTLTWKSSYGFGNEETKDLTMLQLYDLGKVRQMIRAYYFLAKINYIDDILDKIGINDDLRINKPFSYRKEESYKGNELVEKALDNYYSQFSDEKLMGAMKKHKKKMKAKSKRIISEIRCHNSKIANQTRNRKYT